MVSIVYSTAENIKEARRISNELVNEKLVACVNIIPGVESIYRWKGTVEYANEVVLIAKTMDDNVKKTINRIKALHSYEVPDIIVLPIIGGLKDYLDYINLETE